MKLQVELLGVLAYTDKKTNQPKTRVGYRMLTEEYRQDTANLKGFSELSFYVDGHDLFDKLKKEYFGVQAELEVISQPSKNNPMKNVQIVKTIRVGQNVINLL